MKFVPWWRLFLCKLKAARPRHRVVVPLTCHVSLAQLHRLLQVRGGQREQLRVGWRRPLSQLAINALRVLVLILNVLANLSEKQRL